MILSIPTPSITEITASLYINYSQHNVTQHYSQSIMGLIAALSINDTQHNVTLSNKNYDSIKTT
jgi:hypothetical protein